MGGKIDIAGALALRSGSGQTWLWFCACASGLTFVPASLAFRRLWPFCTSAPRCFKGQFVPRIHVSGLFQGAPNRCAHPLS